jgi:hypothetical protein
MAMSLPANTANIIVSININGIVKQYQAPLEITARGTKFANQNQNEAEITITNVDAKTQDYLLTETSPYNLNTAPKVLTVDAGLSYNGMQQTSRIFSGNIVSVNLSQPPDVKMTIRCLTGNYQKGQVVAMGAPETISLSKLAGDIASQLGLNLNFDADDKQIANYNFTGSALKLVNTLGLLSNVDAFIDDDSLVVKRSSLPLAGPTKLIDMQNGMVGIPQITERGLQVKFLLDNQTKVGSLLRVNSVIYPALNGDYIIYKLVFDLATRAENFYYIADAKRLI